MFISFTIVSLSQAWLGVLRLPKEARSTQVLPQESSQLRSPWECNGIAKPAMQEILPKCSCSDCCASEESQCGAEDVFLSHFYSEKKKTKAELKSRKRPLL